MNKESSFKGIHIFSLIVISIFIGYYIGITKIQFEWKDYKPIINVSSKTPPLSSRNLDMKLFYQAIDKINTDYYDKTKIDSQKLLYGAISGMLESLGDPYTSFFPPEQNSSFKQDLSGSFEGIGAELGMSKDNRVMVISPLDNTPSEKAGIKSGDLILRVDGKDTIGWTLPQTVEKIRGPKGTSVNLVVLHEGKKEPVEIKITRGVIKIASVKGWVSPINCNGTVCKKETTCSDCPSISYIRISQFGDKTNEEWTSVVNSQFVEIKKMKNFKGIVLDLRNNPGGYLNDAVFIASEFLKDGVVVKQENNISEIEDKKVIRNGVFLDYPMLVLINKGSASASEIVAGALQDHKRSRLLGEKSFGKGTIQEAVELGGGASVHVSIAKWLTPNGTWVDGKGLEPDIKVELDATESAELVPDQFDNQLQSAIQELIK